jgi:hypothetical protein
MVAALAAVAVGATAVMSPLSAHAAQPQYCYNTGSGNQVCFSSKQQCERNVPQGAGQCHLNRS